MTERDHSESISAQRAELGDLLRQTREEQDISLEEAEKATRIRRQYLQDMEDGALERLPGDVIARGFLRNYAAFLGLDAAEIVSLYRKVLPQAAPGAEWVPMEAAPRWQMEQRPVEVALSGGSGALFPFVRIAVLVVIIAILGLAGWQFLQRNPQFIAALGPAPAITSTPTRGLPFITQATDTPPPMTVRPTSTPTRLVTSPFTRQTPTYTPSATSLPEPTDTPVSGTSVVNGIEMTARITTRAWVQATVDGNIATEGLLDAGEERQWKAIQWLRLDLGNAGGVELTLNGESLGTLGESGQVVRRIWALQNGGIVVTDEEGNPVTTGTESPDIAAAIALTARIVASAWVQATVDGNIEFEGILQPGEERRWAASQWLRLDTDNGGGVELTLNGEPLGTSGEAGQEVSTFWTLQGNQVLRINEPPSASSG